MKETQQVTVEKLGEIIELGADKAVIAALSETVKNIDDNINSLGSAARERLDLAAQHDRQYGALRSAQTGFVAAASPAMMDAQAEINAILGSADLSRDDAVQAARTVEQLAEVIASGNLAASNMTAALLRQQQRGAGSDREGIPGRPAAGQVDPRHAAQEFQPGRAARCDAQLAGPGRGQGQRLQTSPEAARRQRLRRAHPARRPASSMWVLGSACSNWSMASRTRPTTRPG